MIQVDTDILHSLNGKEKAMNGSKLVKELGINCFTNCTNLNSAILENENIPSGCFCNCTSLESIQFGDNVSVLEAGCFQNCHVHPLPTI